MKFCSIKWCHTNFVKYRNFRAKKRYELLFQSNTLYAFIHPFYIQFFYVVSIFPYDIIQDDALN